MIAARLAAIAAGAALATILVFTGPTDVIVCDSGHMLDDWYQGLGGNHIDGASASYCEVPNGLTWLSSAAALAAGVAVALVLRRSTDERRAQPGE